MTAPTREALLAGFAVEREQRQAERLAELLKVRCGRVDDHDAHEWTRPRLLQVPAARYRCGGPGALEGGAR